MNQTNLIDQGDSSGAIFSPCGKYRYSLWREWDNAKPTVVFIGLNPSTANENDDDPTLRRCINFAKDWGFGKLIMVNLFAIRATNPDVMRTAKEPIGKNNDLTLLEECTRADLVVAAWGNHGSHLERNSNVKKLLSDIEMKCFKLTASEQPIHPLYQPAKANLINLK